MPALNEAGNLSSWLPRIQAQLTDRDELIVVDNGSTDQTASVARETGARVIVEPRRGRAFARNAGIRAANSEFVVFVDADCCPEQDWLARLLEPFENARVGCVAGEISIIGSSTSLGDYLEEKNYLSQQVNFQHPFLPFAATGNVAFRMQALEHVGGFDETLIDGEDADLCWRMQLRSEFLVVLASGSVVRHRPPPSAAALFRQKFRHARAAVVLYKKYRWPLSGGASIKKLYWEYRSIVRRGSRYAFACLAARLRLANAPSRAQGYQLSLELGEKLGHLSGSLRQRIWYP